MSHRRQPPRASRTLTSRVVGAWTCTIGFVSVAWSCSSGLGVQEKPCRPGCVDEHTRLECRSDGTPSNVPCEKSPEPCAESVCRAGACEFRPAVDAPCGKDGSARCNAAYVCLGPNVRLTAIAQHTCAVVDDGKVWCWGGGPYGELGDGAQEERARPVLVRGLPGPAIMAAAGYAHTCALLEGGDVYCWGNNSVGQSVPDSTEDPILEPTLVTSPVPFTKIVAGQGHTCGMTADARVYCWGNTAVGQCGVDPANALRVGPTQIPGLDHVSTLTTVKNHICAVRTQDPTLVCWGSNQYLEGNQYVESGTIDHKLGPAAATMKFSAVPLPVDLGKKIVAVGMSYESTYAVTDDGAIYAWGLNASMQLGTGLSDPLLAAPTRVMAGPTTPLSGAVDMIRSDGSDACAQISDGAGRLQYVCWGANDIGELCRGTPDNHVFPFADSPTVLPPSATNFVRGEDHGCAVVTENARADVWCWGKASWVGRGSFDQLASEPNPQPVEWDPSAFAPALMQP